MTTRRKLLKYAVALGAMVTFSPSVMAEGPRPATQPNIVLIMADDLGYECIGANGCDDYQTPALDKLATTGVRFTNCFAQPLCTPSRAKIMTGRYNVRNYVKFGVLDRKEKTFAHVFKDAGYTTCIAGKWQLGNEQMRRSILASINHVSGSTYASAPGKGSAMTAATATPGSRSTANRRIMMMVNMGLISALTSSATLSRRIRRSHFWSITR